MAGAVNYLEKVIRKVVSPFLTVFSAPIQ